MRYQLTCPNCRYEFQYDAGYVERNIEKLGQEIREIQLQLAEHKLLPFDEQRRRTEWWLRAKHSLAYKQKDLADLKAVKKKADQQIQPAQFQILKQLIAEIYGEQTLQLLLHKVDKEMEAYKVSGLMWHEYRTHEK